jgi:hypothetical protein
MPPLVNICTIQAEKQPENATAEPTDKSISPDIMTSVIPKAMMPFIEHVLKTVIMFCHEKKFSFANDKKMNSVISTPISTLRLTKA